MFAGVLANFEDMDEKQFARQLALLRREAGRTQEELAAALHVSPQAVSKWENGHSLPETALLPDLARLLDVSIDQLFNPGKLMILEAFFGDGMASVNVTKRLNRLVENDALQGTASASLLGARIPEERVCFLTVKYQTDAGLCHRAFPEGEEICLTSADRPDPCPESGLAIVAGRYGTRRHHYDVMSKIEHYQPFRWDAYPANHETFPSDPANDDAEYLTLVYRNKDGLHMATCAEGESLAYADGRTRLVRRYKGDSCFIPNMPALPPFGQGMECSWAAALTAALQALGARTAYAEVMGVSGACYRLAFCSPGWDYSAVDGLVAYDYATPGFAAFGYTPAQYCRIEKADRAEHRLRMMKEIRNNMPILGINLRVAPEWGVICGYAKAGEDLFCRTKYDAEV
nr:helix-turn-helix transcriptional regulator [Clostridia bacterium]